MQASPGLAARVSLPPRLLAALRASRRSPGAQHGNRASTAVAAVAQRSPERRETGSGGSDGHVPPSGAELLQQHLTAHQREHVTHEILRGFLEAESMPDVANSSNGAGQRRPRRQRTGDGVAATASTTSASSSSSSSSSNGAGRRQQGKQRTSDGSGGGPTAAAEATQRPRGLQGQVAEHLLGGGFDEALLEPVPTNTLNWVIKVLGQQQQALLAEQLFHWMRVKGKANQHSFVKLCEACGACRQPWRAFQAWRVVRRMPQAGSIVGGHAGAALVLSYRSTADYRGAISALEDLVARGVAVDRYAWNAAIRVCADAGAAEPALRLLGRLRTAAEQQQQQGKEKGVAQELQHAEQRQPGSTSRCTGSGGGSSGRGELHTDVRSYSAALAATAAAGMWNRGAQLHRMMREDGIMPDLPLATQLLSCYAAVGQAGAAQQLFDAMAAAAPPSPNRSHWNALLAAYAAAGDAAGCAAAYRRMGATGLRPDCYTLVALLRAAFHARAGLAAVHAVRAEMARHNVQANRQLATAMLCCLRHVRPDPAAPPLLLVAAAPEAVAGDAQQQADGEQPAASEGQQQEGGDDQPPPQQPEEQQLQQQPHPQMEDQSAACLAEATSVFEALRQQWGRARHTPDLRAYNSLLLVQLAAGDHSGVLSTFEEMEAEEALLPDVTTLGVVITACREAGWKEREAQYHQLLESSRLLGALRHGDEEDGPSGGGSGGQGLAGKRRRRRSHHGGYSKPPDAHGDD